MGSLYELCMHIHPYMKDIIDGRVTGLFGCFGKNRKGGFPSQPPAPSLTRAWAARDLPMETCPPMETVLPAGFPGMDQSIMVLETASRFGNVLPRRAGQTDLAISGPDFPVSVSLPNQAPDSIKKGLVGA